MHPSQDTILQLPCELMSAIFLTVVRSYGTSLPLEFIPTIRFSQVCQLWRDIASSDPSLWTTLRLKGTSVSLQSDTRMLTLMPYENHYYISDSDTILLTPDLLQHDCSALSLFLERSNNLPLKLLVEQGYPYGPSIANSEYGDSLRETLVPALHKFITRCDTLYLRISCEAIPWQETIPILSSAINESVNLRRLVIGPGWMESFEPEAALLNRLEIVVSFDEKILFDISKLRAVNLRRLDVRDYVEWADVLDALRSCPNLRRLSFLSVQGNESDQSSPPSMVHLPHLDCLNLGFDDSEGTASTPLKLFEFVEASALTSFNVEMSYQQHEGDFVYLANFLKRTPALTTLTLRNLRSSEVGFITILQSVPQVKNLRVFNHAHLCPRLRNAMDPLISLLATNAGCDLRSSSQSHLHSRFCPMLQSFSFETAPTGHGTTSTIESIVEFLSSRVAIKDKHDNEQQDGIDSIHECQSGESRFDQMPLQSATFSIGIPPDITLPYAGICERFIQEGVQLVIK